MSMRRVERQVKSQTRGPGLDRLW